jgi:hypothetical protein
MWPSAWSGTDDKALVNFGSAAAKFAIGSGTKSKTPSPAFSAVLRAYRRALLANDAALSEGLIAWGGQPNVAAAVKRAAGVKGDLDAFGAMHFLAGLLTILRDSGRPGLVIVLDEAETLQRMRADTREKGLNALRQVLDELDAGRLCSRRPGLPRRPSA